MEPLDLSVTRAAKALGVTRKALSLTQKEKPKEKKEAPKSNPAIEEILRLRSLSSGRLMPVRAEPIA